MLNSQRKNAGFSLTEVMITVCVFAICLIALAKFASTIFTLNSNAMQRSEALNYAQQKMADFRSYAKLINTTGYTAYQDIVDGSDTVTGANATYTRVWDINENTVVGFKTVDIVVSWTDQNGSNKSVRLNSIIGEIDPAWSGRAIMATSSGGLSP